LKRLDHTFPTPAENLAADEALLDRCETEWGESDGPRDHAAETLFFWEPRETFVVVGYANQVSTEVAVAKCAARQIPIFRRSSGGGAVVQMPGSLNYSLILRITPDSPTRGITSANQFIMEKNRAALETLLPGSALAVRGHTDLCVGNVKFAGNSQRRRKHFLLFHGTLLLNCDLQWISELLPMPSQQPDYRVHRPHAEFVTNLKLPAGIVKTALATAWGANEELKNPPLDEIQRLAREKYSTREWNFKF
jgi:lipoate-protein ligase A